MHLDTLPLNQIARISRIHWSRLSEAEGHRLRCLGFDEGVEVQPLHRGWLLFKDPLAVRVGRMTVAIRATHAAAIEVDAA
ncbi:MAG: ferrous iron transport protein A [Alphaproteobacteria bacterium]|nr:ferrous iron transport protein A [Alphaproteobacteria bacterium]